MDEFKKKHGLELRVGTEPEMMWLTKNPDGTPTGKGFSKPYCYHICLLYTSPSPRDRG